MITRLDSVGIVALTLRGCTARAWHRYLEIWFLEVPQVVETVEGSIHIEREKALEDVDLVEIPGRGPGWHGYQGYQVHQIIKDINIGMMTEATQSHSCPSSK